ncbi:hypothetical protein GmHk_10G028066 [Glycine max]|nr:hypothetical protein GmHk_10G028066 [Glycine max]
MVFYFRLYTCLRERQSYLGKNIYSMMRLTLPMKILFSYTRLNQRPYLEKIKHVLLKSITGWSSAIFSAKLTDHDHVLDSAIAVALKCGHGTSSMKCKIDPNSEVNKKLKSTSFSTTNASYPSQAKFD